MGAFHYHQLSRVSCLASGDFEVHLKCHVTTRKQPRGKSLVHRCGGSVSGGRSVACGAPVMATLQNQSARPHRPNRLLLCSPVRL